MHTTRPWYRATLGDRASLIAAATLLGVVCAGITIVTPLYPLYQRTFDVPELTVTLVYATYVVGNPGVVDRGNGTVRDRIGIRISRESARGQSDSARRAPCRIAVGIPALLL